jgi:hypothetical protein
VFGLDAIATVMAWNRGDGKKGVEKRVWLLSRRALGGRHG